MTVQAVFTDRDPGFVPRSRSFDRVRTYIHTLIPHFHVCHGMRPGGPFLQENEAWEVHDMVIGHVARVVVEEASLR